MARVITVIAMFAMTVGGCFILYFFLENTIGIFGRKTTQRKSPNIIVIIADDLGWDDVSYHGSNQIPTPNIDALAYNGVILDKHYVLPKCTPSRVAFLTGYYPIRSGMQGPPLRVGEPRGIPLNFTLLPEYLRDLGYKTHLVGKWHVGYFADSYLPTSRGFDTFFGYYNAYIRYFSYRVMDWNTNVTGYDLHREENGTFMIDYTPKCIYATDLFTEEAEKIIVKHDKATPLYLQLSHLAPHRAGLVDSLQVRSKSQVNDTFGYILDYDRRLYAGMVSALDDSVGRIVEALDKEGILNDSIIVFMSDNGGRTVGPNFNTGSNYPYRAMKGSLFDGGVHTPALIWSSMIEKTSRIYDDYIHMTDWLPTFYRAAGGDVDDLGSIDGVDQWEAISRGFPGPRNSLLLNIDEVHNVAAAIEGKFKYIIGETDVNGSYFGDHVNDGDPSAPPYDVTSILNSMAARAIKNATKMSSNETADVEKMLRLREDSKVVCSRKVEPADCALGCLMNLEADPCETEDVSAEYPVIVQRLRDSLTEYRKVLVPLMVLLTDPRSYPKRSGGPWLPWLNDDGEYAPHNFTAIVGDWNTSTDGNVKSYIDVFVAST